MLARVFASVCVLVRTWGDTQNKNRDAISDGRHTLMPCHTHTHHMHAHCRTGARNDERRTYGIAWRCTCATAACWFYTSTHARTHTDKSTHIALAFNYLRPQNGCLRMCAHIVASQRTTDCEKRSVHDRSSRLIFCWFCLRQFRRSLHIGAI